MTRHPFVASPGDGCSTCGQLRSAAIHDWETMTQQDRTQLLADFALALFTFVDVLERPVEESFNTLLTRAPFAPIATTELRAAFTDEME